MCVCVCITSSFRSSGRARIGLTVVVVVVVDVGIAVVMTGVVLWLSLPVVVAGKATLCDFSMCVLSSEGVVVVVVVVRNLVEFCLRYCGEYELNEPKSGESSVSSVSSPPPKS